MRIGLIGVGKIGGTLATLLVDGGHQVVLANSRGPETLADTVRALGPSAGAGTAAEAVDGADLVVEAIPFGRYRELPADALRGRIVVDAANYYPDRDGHVPALDAGAATSSEIVAGHLAGARVVKAFNTIYWEHLRDRGAPDAAPDARLAIPVAGDDAEAKQVVADLIAAFGFVAVDAGPLAEGRRQEPGTPVFGNLTDAATTRDLLARA